MDSVPIGGWLIGGNECGAIMEGVLGPEFRKGLFHTWPQSPDVKPYNLVMCPGVRTPLPVGTMGDRQSCDQGEPNSLASLWLLASLEDLPHLRKPCTSAWSLTWAETSRGIFPVAVLSRSPEPLDSTHQVWVAGPAGRL